MLALTRRFALALGAAVLALSFGAQALAEREVVHALASLTVGDLDGAIDRWQRLTASATTLFFAAIVLALGGAVRSRRGAPALVGVAVLAVSGLAVRGAAGLFGSRTAATPRIPAELEGLPRVSLRELADAEVRRGLTADDHPGDRSVAIEVAGDTRPDALVAGLRALRADCCSHAVLLVPAPRREVPPPFRAVGWFDVVPLEVRRADEAACETPAAGLSGGGPVVFSEELWASPCAEWSGELAVGDLVRATRAVSAAGRVLVVRLP